MTSPDNDGEDIAAFSRLFAAKGFASERSALNEREKIDRHAGKTTKQRANKAVRTAQVNLRTTAANKAQYKVLADHLGVSVAQAIDHAVNDTVARLRAEGEDL